MLLTSKIILFLFYIYCSKDVNNQEKLLNTSTNEQMAMEMVKSVIKLRDEFDVGKNVISIFKDEKIFCEYIGLENLYKKIQKTNDQYQIFISFENYKCVMYTTSGINEEIKKNVIREYTKEDINSRLKCIIYKLCEDIFTFFDGIYIFAPQTEKISLIFSAEKIFEPNLGCDEIIQHIENFINTTFNNRIQYDTRFRNINVKLFNRFFVYGKNLNEGKYMSRKLYKIKNIISIKNKCIMYTNYLYIDELEKILVYENGTKPFVFSKEHILMCEYGKTVTARLFNDEIANSFLEVLSKKSDDKYIDLKFSIYLALNTTFLQHYLNKLYTGEREILSYIAQGYENRTADDLYKYFSEKNSKQKFNKIFKSVVIFLKNMTKTFKPKENKYRELICAALYTYLNESFSYLQERIRCYIHSAMTPHTKTFYSSRIPLLFMCDEYRITDEILYMEDSIIVKCSDLCFKHKILEEESIDSIISEKNSLSLRNTEFIYRIVNDEKLCNNETEPKIQDLCNDGINNDQ